MLLVEEEAVLSIEDAGASGTTDEIPNRITADGRRREERSERVHVEISSRGQQSSRNEERVAG